MAGRGRRGQSPDSSRIGVGSAAKVFVLNPAGLDNPALAIAGSRAGAVGVLNAEFGAAAEWILPALRRLAEFGGSSIGLKLTEADVALLPLLEEFYGRLDHLIVDFPLLSDAGEEWVPRSQLSARMAQLVQQHTSG